MTATEAVGRIRLEDKNSSVFGRGEPRCSQLLMREYPCGGAAQADNQTSEIQINQSSRFIEGVLRPSPRACLAIERHELAFRAKPHP